MNAEPKIHESTDRNPFVGPVPLSDQQTIYGRERETCELSDLIVSKRVVLLFSPSGAGKTSLIQAALLPALSNKRYGLKPLPLVRLSRFGGEPETSKPANRFTLATLRALESTLFAGKPLSDDELAGYNLVDYFRERLGPDRTRLGVLVFDQFEELFTTDPFDIAAKQAFLKDLGAVLAGAHEPRRAMAAAGDDDPEGDDDGDDSRRSATIWALFAMREDRIAELEPYLHLLPTGLSYRYRIDCLGDAQAMDAIVKPSRGRIAPDVARKLVDDLRSVTVTVAGKPVPKMGPHVEPVQLQVVCRGLWEKVVVRDQRSIGLADVESLCDGTTEVERALRAYFDAEMAIASGGAFASERALRHWVETKLISPGGIRVQALIEAEQMKDGLGDAVRGLVEAHVLRSDSRNGSEWVELAHDRLVSPVRASNAAWRLTNLKPFQLRADQWEAATGSRSKLLIFGTELMEARRFARTNPRALREIDKRFIHESGRTQRWKLWILAAIGVAVVSLTMFLLYSAETAREQAVAAKEKELQAQKWAAEGKAKAAFYTNARFAEQRRPQSLAIPALLGLSEEARKFSQLERTHINRLLRIALGNVPAVIERSLQPHRHLVSDLVFSADGQRLISSSWDQTLAVRDLAARPAAFAPSAKVGSETYAMAYHETRGLVASTYMDGRIVLWRLDGEKLQQLGTATSPETAARPQITSAAFTADGTRLVTVGWDRVVRVWGIDDPQKPTLQASLPKGETYIQQVLVLSANGSDGERIASADLNGVVRIWSLPVANGQQAQRVLRIKNHTTKDVAIYSLAADPFGRYLVAGDYVGNVHLWDLRDPATKGIQLTAETHAVTRRNMTVRDVAFAPDGSEFATVSLDGTLIRWRLPAGVSGLAEVDRQIVATRFGPIGERLFSAAYRPGHPASLAVGGTRSVWLFDLDRGNSSVLATPIRAQGGEMPTWRQVSVDRKGSVIGARSEDRRIHLWRRNADRFAAIGVLPVEATAFAVTRGGDEVLAADCSSALTSWPVPIADALPPVSVATAATTPADECRPTVLAVSEDGLLAVTGGEGTLAVWQRTDDGWRNPAGNLSIAGRVTSLAIDSAAERLAVGVLQSSAQGSGQGSSQGMLYLFKIGRDASGGVSLQQRKAEQAGAELRSVAFVPGADAIIAGEVNGFLTQWKLPDLTSSQAPEFRHERAISTIVFADRQDPLTLPQMFTTDLDGVALEWTNGSLEGGIIPVPAPGDRIHSAAVSGDGLFLITAGDEKLLGWNFSPESIAQIARTYDPPRQADTRPTSAPVAAPPSF